MEFTAFCGGKDWGLKRLLLHGLFSVLDFL